VAVREAGAYERRQRHGAPKMQALVELSTKIALQPADEARFSREISASKKHALELL